MDSNMVPITITAPFTFGISPDEIMARAAALGRLSGFDADWAPDTLQQAVYELLISSGGYDEVLASGVCPRPDLAADPIANDLFCLSIDLRIERPSQDVEDIAQARPICWDASILSDCLSVLMLPAACLDYGIEIVELVDSVDLSAHETLEQFNRITKSQDLHGTI